MNTNVFTILISCIGADVNVLYSYCRANTYDFSPRLKGSGGVPSQFHGFCLYRITTR